MQNENRNPVQNISYERMLVAKAERCQEKAVRMDGDSHVIGGVDVSGSKLLQKEGGT
jgi:hypothetical protein